jgi:hypothetical protein
VVGLVVGPVVRAVTYTLANVWVASDPSEFRSGRPSTPPVARIRQP